MDWNPADPGTNRMFRCLLLAVVVVTLGELCYVGYLFLQRGVVVPQGAPCTSHKRVYATIRQFTLLHVIEFQSWSSQPGEHNTHRVLVSLPCSTAKQPQLSDVSTQSFSFSLLVLHLGPVAVHQAAPQLHSQSLMVRVPVIFFRFWKKRAKSV